VDDLLVGSDDENTAGPSFSSSSPSSSTKQPATDHHSLSSINPDRIPSLSPLGHQTVKKLKQPGRRRTSKDSSEGRPNSSEGRPNSSEGRPTGSGKKNAVCPLCADTFTEKELSVHVRRDHAYQCAYCPLRFTYVNGRDNHQNSAHTLEATVASQLKLSCRLCGMGFSRHTAYAKHAKREHSVPCRERGCQRRFTNPILMENHVVGSHPRSGGAAAPEAERTAPPVKTASSPVRVRNVYSEATIVDSPKKGSAAASSIAVKRTAAAMADLEATKASLSAAFNIKVRRKSCYKYHGRS
jgi:hypothetical protein